MGQGGDSGEKHGEAEEVPRPAGRPAFYSDCGARVLSHPRHPSALTPLACLNPERA